jgi:hypothetical protein
MTEYENCQNCGKPIEDGKFCSPQCHRLYLQKPEGPKPLLVKDYGSSENPALDHELETQLTDTQWQKGLQWRQEKLEAIAEARRRGIKEEEIFKILKKSGLTDQTARKTMKDARYFE